ncbi:hypothetical protein CALVIDRAFT_405769 [Calocera viscosa TUFC12733]|uniref:Uncharacterized protein n=1 Tax=Calocera viscosa (strain TUFC12733) TaxID=1330018 RepID=A0A167PY89_CALVF|nr:hypothetical protein CALVIDRAFT_405769 [Calocera viscosa TUFC12733]
MIGKALESSIPLLIHQPISPVFLAKYIALLGHLLKFDPPCCRPRQPHDWQDRYEAKIEAWAVVYCLKRLFDGSFQMEPPEAVLVTRPIRRALLQCLSQNARLLDIHDFAQPYTFSTLVGILHSVDARHAREDLLLIRPFLNYLLPEVSDSGSVYDGRTPQRSCQLAREWLDRTAA